MTHKEYLTDLLTQDQVLQVIKELLAATKKNGQDDLNSNLVLLSAQYYGNENQFKKEIISPDNYKLTKAKVRYALGSYLDDYEEDGTFVPPVQSPISNPNPSPNPNIMKNKPTALMVFAANDLAEVKNEAAKIWKSVSANESITAVKTEDTDIEQLVDAVIDSEDLFMFHFGGHSSEGGILLEDSRSLDATKLSNILLPNNHKLQIIFLNGCLSYGQVGLFTARGVKVVIATNVEVDDKEATRVGAYFYRLFFEKNYSLKNAFETAEATAGGKKSFITIVNPGAIMDADTNSPSWTLYVHAQHTNVLEWTLADFVEDTNVKSNSNNPQNKGKTFIQNADKIYNIDKIDNANFS